MRFLLFLFLPFPVFSQTCDDIISTYDGQSHSLTVPHKEKTFNALLMFRPEVFPERLTQDGHTYTFLNFVIYRETQTPPRAKNQKGLYITFEDGSKLDMPGQAFYFNDALQYKILLLVTPQNAIDFTTKKIKSFRMAGKTGKVNPETANAVMVYTKCLLEY